MTTPATLQRALSTFTARSPHRDAEVDRERFASLEASIDELVEAVSAERAGIVQRVRRTLDDPNPRPPSWTLGRKAGLSKAEFVVLEDRLRDLDHQMLELRKIKAMLAELSAPLPQP